MKISERAQEILETLWVYSVEQNKGAMDVGAGKADPAIDELVEGKYIKAGGDKISFTAKGEQEGERVVRRHRLSERFFADILGIKKNKVHPLSCQLEHLLQDEVEDNICTLLGHPKTCPHGKPIPAGECCEKSKTNDHAAIASLDQWRTNVKSKVIYIHTKDQIKLQKLMAMGVLPGASITLIQRSPSYVFSIGHAQFAIDKGLAQAIFVRCA